VPAIVALLTIGSLALVFGAVLGALPMELVPRAAADTLAAIPHVNAGLSLVAIGVIISGWRWIRNGRIRRHRAAMLLAAGLFASFLGLYLYRVAILGPTPFPGPEFVYLWLYLPILAIHIALAILCIPLVYYVLLIGLTHPVAAIQRTRHATVGRIAATLWLVSFTLGTVVYLLLYVIY